MDKAQAPPRAWRAIQRLGFRAGVIDVLQPRGVRKIWPKIMILAMMGGRGDPRAGRPAVVPVADEARPYDLPL